MTGQDFCPFSKRLWVAREAVGDTGCVEPTANRSVVGVTNEFGYLAEEARAAYGEDLLGLAVRLGATPCSPLYQRHVSPDRELVALVAARRAHY